MSEGYASRIFAIAERIRFGCSREFVWCRSVEVSLKASRLLRCGGRVRVGLHRGLLNGKGVKVTVRVCPFAIAHSLQASDGYSRRAKPTPYLESPASRPRIFTLALQFAAYA